MRTTLAVLILLFNFAAMGQSSFRDTYNKWFPNNKALQIQNLTSKTDSLQRLNDSLMDARLLAINKINSLKTEITAVKTELFHEKNKVKQSQDSIQHVLTTLRDSLKQLTYPLVNCREEKLEFQGHRDELVNTCQWRMYQIIETGKQQPKGQYEWKTEIFRKDGDSMVVVKTENLFKSEKIKELEAIVNQRLEEDFKVLQNDEPLCFKKKQQYNSFRLSEMRISFNDHSEINFEVDFGLEQDCYAVSIASTSLRIMELKPFFVEE